MLILDGSKIMWHKERLEFLLRGERVAPITIDMALTRACNYKCVYCYSQLQSNVSRQLNWEILKSFINDCAEIGVKAISLVSDGESTLSSFIVRFIKYAEQKGLDIALGTNGACRDIIIYDIISHLTYIRFNISSAIKRTYDIIHGCDNNNYYQVISNIKYAVMLKKEYNFKVTIGMQMVLMKDTEKELSDLAQLAIALEVDYLVIKHCSDDEKKSLGIDYKVSKELKDKLVILETMSTEKTKIIVKWSKILSEGKKNYMKCYAPALHLQISGSGLVAPCGMLFNEKYKKYHIGNIADKSFKEIWQSDRYWEVMNLLKSENFNAELMCGTLCLQHKTNEIVNTILKQGIDLETCEAKLEKPEHINFI